MPEKHYIFDTESARMLSSGKLVKLLKDLGCNRIIYKKLAPNDNSKNQPYFGSHLTDLPFLPTKNITATQTSSQKAGTDKRSTKFVAEFPLVWIDASGKKYSAPNAKLIYYPQYPEVRFSGFLSGSEIECGNWMDPTRNGRSEGRVLFLGINQRLKTTFAFLAIPTSRISFEISEQPSFELTSIFREIALDQETAGTISPRNQLLCRLQAINKKGWIDSKRLNSGGSAITYKAQNGGGYTLEAELGIVPNGDALPDFMGWEVKQFAANNFFTAFSISKGLTLFTPEPTDGEYVELGAAEFAIKYGIVSKTEPTRYDFTGRHFFGQRQSKSGFRLHLTGFDYIKRVLDDATGGIVLLNDNNNVIAKWNYSKIIERWKVKHTQAVYVPSNKQTISSIIQYRYSHLIRLYNTTNINLLLNSIHTKSVYYDPGINVKNVNTKPLVHARSQFRIKVKDLNKLYINREDINLLEHM